MALEVPSPANDNFSPGELRDARKRQLLVGGSLILSLRELVTRRREEFSSRAAQLLSEDQPIGDLQESQARLDALGSLIEQADTAIGSAEQNIDNLELFGRALLAVRELKNGYEDVRDVLGEGEI